MATRLTTCATCGAAVAFAHNIGKLACLEPAGFAATITAFGVVMWQDTFRQHVCQPAAVDARKAFIESVTTEEERRRAQDLAEQRELAREIAKSFVCPKQRCEADVGEGCINLTILARQDKRVPTAWPHPERMALAMKAIEERSEQDAEEQQQGAQEPAPTASGGEPPQ